MTIKELRRIQGKFEGMYYHPCQGMSKQGASCPNEMKGGYWCPRCVRTFRQGGLPRPGNQYW